MRRSSKSIPRNIAEGWGRRESENDFKRFLVIAIGSCDEIGVDLDFCRDLGYMTVEVHKDYTERYVSVRKRLIAFRARWQRF
jgi:four helix bundle protein